MFRVVLLRQMHIPLPNGYNGNDAMKVMYFFLSLASTTRFEKKITNAIQVEEGDIFLFGQKIHFSLIDSLIRIKIGKEKMQYASNKELGMMNGPVIRIIGIPGGICFQTK